MRKTFFFNMKIATHNFGNYVQYEHALCLMTYTQMIAYTTLFPDTGIRLALGKRENDHYIFKTEIQRSFYIKFLFQKQHIYYHLYFIFIFYKTY